MKYSHLHKKRNYIFASFAIALAGMALTGCSQSDEPDFNQPEELPADIHLGAIITEISSRWVTEGSILTISIPEFNYSCTDPEMKLSAISLIHAGDTIATRPFKEGFSISTTVGAWAHGDNELTLSAIFSTPTWTVEKEFMHPKVIVFNELPHYEIEGTIEKDIKWLASNGEKFQHFFTFSSVDHVFRIGSITWTASNGERFTFNKLADMTPTFHIVESATNFDADITSTELHWFRPDGPAIPSQEDYLTGRTSLYGDFTVRGIHEDILVETSSTEKFTLVAGTTETDPNL